MKDADFLQQQWQNFLKELAEDWNKFESRTLKEYIQRGSEIITRMIDNKVIDVKPGKISSYLYTQLNNIGLTVSLRWIQENLPDDLKRNYFESEVASESPKWEVLFDKGDLIEQDQYGHTRINGKEFVEKKTSEPKAETKPSKLDQYNIIIKQIQESATHLETACRTIFLRYNTDENVRDMIKKYFEKPKETLKQYQELHAKIANAKSVLDDRNKFGDYEKCMALFLMEGGETIAHIAKLMDYSSKFGSIGILKNDDIRNKIKQLGECPKCHGNIYFEINEKLKQAEIQAQFEL